MPKKISFVVKSFQKFEISTMKRTVILYALALAGLVFLLKIIEYKFFIRDLPIAFYVGIVALMFSGVGIWAGMKLTKKKVIEITKIKHVEEHPGIRNNSFDPVVLDKLGISKRELEVLELMAQGFSNQEIADKLFVSLNTIKTHAANLFVKLDVKRRTQAIQRAKELSVVR